MKKIDERIVKTWLCERGIAQAVLLEPSTLRGKRQLLKNQQTIKVCESIVGVYNIARYLDCDKAKTQDPKLC